MEAQRERLRRLGLHHVLATHVLAALGDVQPAPMHRAEQPPPAVMTRLKPVCAIGLLMLCLYHCWPMAEPDGLELRGADVGDHQRGMRSRGTGRIAPLD